MAGYKITDEDGLITTTVHGMDQDVFMVTEDRVNSFNSYSVEFQIWITLFSVDLGYFLSKIDNRDSTGFITSLILGLVFLVFLIINYLKFKKVRNDLFTRAKNKTTNNTVIN